MQIQIRSIVRVLVPAVIAAIGVGALLIGILLVLLWTQGLQHERVFWLLLWGFLIVAMGAYDLATGAHGYRRWVIEIGIASGVSYAGALLAGAH